MSIDRASLVWLAAFAVLPSVSWGAVTNAVADTNVKYNSGSSYNYDDAATVSYAGQSRKLYAKFDLSGMHPAHLLNRAILKLQATAAVSMAPLGRFHVYGLNDEAPGLNPGDPTEETWNDRVNWLRWNNAPGNDTNTHNTVLSAVTTDLGTFDVTNNVAPGDEFTFSSPALLDFIQDDMNDVVTLILTCDEPLGKFLTVATRENTSYAPIAIELTVPRGTVMLVR